MYQKFCLLILLVTAMLSPGCKNNSELAATKGEEFARKAIALAQCRLSGSVNCDEKLNDDTLMTVEMYSWGEQKGFSVSAVLKGTAECKSLTHHSFDSRVGVMLNQTVVKNIGDEMHYAFADEVCADGSTLFKASIRLIHPPK